MIDWLKDSILTYKTKHFYRQFINPNELCFDIGANHGVKSKLFLSLGAKVIAFEPQSTCIASLDLIKQNHANFSFEHIALSDQSGVASLQLANHSEIATLSQKFVDHHGGNGLEWKGREEIQVDTLDRQIKKFGLPDFCKIDTEGHEKEILEGLTVTLPFLEFEFTGGFIEETLDSIHHLSSLGDYEFNYMKNEIPQLMSPYWFSKKEMAKKLLELPTHRLHGNIFAKVKT